MAMDWSKFAEHRLDSAPEAVPQRHMSHSSKLAVELESQPEQHEVKPVVDQEYKRRILGLAPGLAFALLLLSFLFIAGVVIGAIFLVNSKRHDSHAANPTATATTSASLYTGATATGYGSATATPTALKVLAAAYANATGNVTEEAMEVLPQGPNLAIDLTSKLQTNPWSRNDPWFGVKKCFSLLYSFGPSIRTFVGCDSISNSDSDSDYTLVPGDVEKSPNSYAITRWGPSDADFAIVSVVWGSLEIRNQSVYDAIYQCKQNGVAVPFDNTFFGNDTLQNWPKTGVIWYTEDNFQTFKSISSVEDGSVHF